MIRRPPRSTPLYSSAASDVYKRQLDHRVTEDFVIAARNTRAHDEIRGAFDMPRHSWLRRVRNLGPRRKAISKVPSAIEIAAASPSAMTDPLASDVPRHERCSTWT